MKKLAILLSLVVLPAYAETINFRIPVDVKNLMPDVRNVRVECRLYSAKPAGWFAPGQLETFMQKLPVDQTGKVQQVVQTTINTDPNKPNPQYFQCGFELELLDGTYVAPDPSSPRDSAKARQGTKFLAKVESSITEWLKTSKVQ